MQVIKKTFLIITIFLIANIQSFAQDSLLKQGLQIHGNFSYFNVDNLGNIYLVNNNNQLKKINSNGDSVGVFNDVRKYGKLFYIDATNPLKLLLYYQNFSTIVILDRFLNIRNVINLRKTGIFKVKAIGTSYDNNIWIFDEGDAKLKKIDDKGDVLTETVDCRLLFDTIPSPNIIIDRDGYVTLYDFDKGFFVFDIYGSLKNKQAFTQWQGVEVLGTSLYGFKHGKLLSYVANSLNLKEYSLPNSFTTATQIKIAENKLYTLDSSGLCSYTIQ